MSANGSDRHRMTGLPSTTCDNLAWLAEAAVSQSPSSTARPSEGMLSGSRSAQTQGHDSHAMLSAGASTMANMGAILRPSVSASSDPAQRLLASGAQYPGGQPPYSALYSTHGQPSHLASLASPYGSFYHPYSPSSFSPSSHFPHIESYSAVLASMGSHVQHGQQGQVTRGGHFLPPGPMSQYSALSHRSHSAASSPGPSPAHQRGSPHLGDGHLPDQKSPKTEPRENDSRGHGLRQGSAGAFREDKPQLSPLSGSGSITKGSVGHSRESPKSELFAGYKVPSGKEGSLKHRILTRPHEEGPGEGGGKMAGEGQEDVVPAKRPKLSSSSKAQGNHGQVPLFAPVCSAAPMSSGHHPLMAGPGPPPAHSTSVPYSSTSSPPVPGPSPEAYYGHPSTTEAATSSSSSGPPSSELFYPPHFMKGSIIQLANGMLKRVEELQTDDFVHSAQISTDLKVDSSRVVSIQRNLERSTAILGFSVGESQVQVTVEATLEHPFFVFQRGWSSCSPERTQQRYGLDCHPLNVGDMCISLTHKDVSLHSAELSQQQQQPPHPASGAPHSVGERGQGEGGGSSERRGLVHAHSSELTPSGPGYDDSSGGLRPPRKRRWSAPDVDSSEEEGHVPPHQSQQQQQGGKEREQTVTCSAGSSLAPTTTGASSSSLPDTQPSS